MLTFKSFTGINNVLPQERLSPDALTVAKNVDAGLTGELRRRQGYALAAEGCHKNLFQAEGFLLATCDGDLKNVDTGAVLYAGLGSSRVWYAQLPDGRVAWSNGLICGLTDGATATTWGVPIPPSVGALTEIAGDLYPGEYQWQITYVRLSDGLEGGPAYSSAPVRVEDGGVFLSGLPVESGYKINVYLTSHDDGRAFYAGSTTNGLFSFTGKNDELTLPCRTEFMQPAPAGRCLTVWRNRVLVADGNVLYASAPNTAELFDVRRDFKQFVDPITAVIPVDDGIYVGTEKELAFLAGDRFDNLVYRRVVNGSVVLGSGVSVRAELVKQGEGAGMGAAALCIADGGIVAGFNGGGVVRMTEGRYKTAVTEVHASFRMRAGIPQYMAIPA